MARRLSPDSRFAGFASGLALILAWHLVWSAASGMETRPLTRPNEQPDVILDVARQYGVTHVLVEYVLVDGELVLQTPDSLKSIVDTPPDFLVLVPLEYANARLYAIRDS